MTGVETMFTMRTTPWNGLGTNVREAPASEEALQMAGLDWRVEQKSVYVDGMYKAEGYYANVRNSDHRVLGIVTDRYKVIQNDEAFSFTDGLLGEGVRYETAGSLMGGRKVWLLARLPKEYIIEGESIIPYLVFSNTHDGSGAVKVAVTPVRVECNNTLNLALKTAPRSWSMVHTGDIQGKVQEVQETLFHADNYMRRLGTEFKNLRTVKLSDEKIEDFIAELIPLEKEATATQKKNAETLRQGIRRRYYDAPDLQWIGKNAYRFINAVSDFATHQKPLRKTANYRENLFARTMDGHPLIDKAYQMVIAA